MWPRRPRARRPFGCGSPTAARVRQASPMADGAETRLSAELEEERERVRELKKLLRQERKQVRPLEISPRRVSA